MEEDKIIAEETKSLDSDMASEQPSACDKQEEQTVQLENAAAVSNDAVSDDLTEEERLEKERKAKRAEKLQPLKYFL